MVQPEPFPVSRGILSSLKHGLMFLLGAFRLIDDNQFYRLTSAATELNNAFNGVVYYFRKIGQIFRNIYSSLARLPIVGALTRLGYNLGRIPLLPIILTWRLVRNVLSLVFQNQLRTPPFEGYARFLS